MAEIKVYGLTTCPHCKKAEEYLKKIGADFEVVYIDKLEGEERKKVIEEVHKISGRYSVPLIVKGDKFVLGYVEDKLRELAREG
ncbi:glutaredoxin family protein [Archaeoglobales archaeon]|nr:MAG: glutaredoxin family protein [Archaeoglobales archaeon]